MATILIVCLALVLIGAGIVFFSLRRAQHGFEDDEGFHRDHGPKR